MARAERYDAGDLDRRLRILRRTQVGTDAYNSPVYAYPAAVTVWARRQDASLGESLRAREVAAQITAHFVVRHSPETAATTAVDRVELEGGLTYDVVGVRELARNEWLEIHAVAREEG